ncbi:metallophosphoesterase [Mucisphaera calidilacus]|uniref:Putative metallophosphoesterase n=1 Tax=Mucisphaera calidilacus TaxID=2527982 RepID=A0A518BXI9_9BACT|nr:metallophosphoesterase [Mucisphaera calidilacus]QDU71690.1 putative metallophosphoesterase [Mucisphaera calidilacus]
MPVDYGLLEATELAIPTLPDALEGIRIAHLTDLHIRRRRDRHTRIIDRLARVRLDLILYTGDYMSYPGDEEPAAEVMTDILSALKPRHGQFGVFGNHDTFDLARRLHDLPITWLNNRSVTLSHLNLEIFGLQGITPTGLDPVAVALDRDTDHQPAVRLGLVHNPSHAPAVADLKADLIFCGHTHGGQCRPHPSIALANSCDLPKALSTGILRHRNAQIAISRGLGEIALPLRTFCPPHIPVYTLRKRSIPGTTTDSIKRLRWW